MDFILNKPVFPAEKLTRYPHMFPLDIAIWERFLEAHAADFDGFAYDVKVGTGTQPAGDVTANFARMQQELSRYRIDVVGVRGNRIEILEVKPDASASALGQVITYLVLYVKEHNIDLPVIGGIVTDRERPDMKTLTAEMGLLYYIV